MCSPGHLEMLSTQHQEEEDQETDEEDTQDGQSRDGCHAWVHLFSWSRHTQTDEILHFHSFFFSPFCFCHVKSKQNRVFVLRPLRITRPHHSGLHLPTVVMVMKAGLLGVL